MSRRRVLLRAVPEPPILERGRTLVGMALPWERPALVNDYGGRPYLEDYDRTSCDRTLRQRPGPHPMDRYHGMDLRNEDPIGATHFERTAEGLIFRSVLSRTRKADEALALYKDGAYGDVSVASRPINHRLLQTLRGILTHRTEIDLRGLALTPTGYGQIPGAQVMALRADQLGTDVTFDDQEDAVSDAIEAKLWGDAGCPSGCWLNVRAVTDSWAVYEVEGGPLDKPELNDTWRFDYTVTDGAVTLSDAPVQVSQVWQPVDAALRASSTPRLDRWKRLNGR